MPLLPLCVNPSRLAEWLGNGASPTRGAAAAAARQAEAEQQVQQRVQLDRGQADGEPGGHGKSMKRKWEAPRFKAAYIHPRAATGQGTAATAAMAAAARMAAEQGHGMGLGIRGEQAGEARGGGRRRKRATVQPTAEQLAATIAELAAAAYAPSSQRAIKAAMGAWRDFEAVMREERPDLLLAPRFAGDMEASLHNETSLMMFAAWMLKQGLAASTVGTYLSLVKTNLGTTFGWALTCKELEMRLPKLLKGIRRMHKRIRKKRLGWRAVYERDLHKLIGQPANPEARTQKAIRCTLRQGLLRGADVVPERVALFDAERHSMVSDLEHFPASEHFEQPHFRLRVLPAKKGEQQGKDEFVYLPKGNGVTDAYTAIMGMREDRRAAGTWQAGMPLWLKAGGETWVVAEVRALYKASGKALGIATKHLGAHCGRIGGATDLFAEGCDAVLLQMQGRWYAARRTAQRAMPARTHAYHETRYARDRSCRSPSASTEAYAPPKGGLCAVSEAYAP